MFKAKATARRRPSIDWAPSGDSATLKFKVEELQFAVGGDPPGGEVEVSLELSRHVIFWLWGNIDRQLVKEVFDAQERGVSSLMLEEVRSAMEGFEDSGDH